MIVILSIGLSSIVVGHVFVHHPPPAFVDGGGDDDDDDDDGVFVVEAF